jgi:hypothetical protein
MSRKARTPDEPVAVIEPQATGNASAECYKCDWTLYGPLRFVAWHVLLHIEQHNAEVIDIWG